MPRTLRRVPAGTARAAQSEPAAPTTTQPPTVADTTVDSPPQNLDPTQSAAAATVQTTSIAGSGEPSDERVRIRIMQAGSRIRFEIDEILRGSSNRVVGTTDQVAGDLIIDFASPPDS